MERTSKKDAHVKRRQPYILLLDIAFTVCEAVHHTTLFSRFQQGQKATRASDTLYENKQSTVSLRLTKIRNETFKTYVQSTPSYATYNTANATRESYTYEKERGHTE